MAAPASEQARPRTMPASPSQLIALGLVAASIGWAAWLLRDRSDTDEVEFFQGHALSSSELATVEAAFDRAKLTGYRTESGRVWVPRGNQSAFSRAIVDGKALPRRPGTSLQQAIEHNGVWTSSSARAEAMRVATQDELSYVLCSMPGIEQAAVLYDVEARTGFNQDPLKTASVSLLTHPGTELDAARANGIRVLVSASIAGLTPERVVVTDLGTGRVYSGTIDTTDDTAVLDPALVRRLAHERALAGRIRQALAFVRGVNVDVAVEFAPPPAQSAVVLAPQQPIAGDEAVVPRALGAANQPAEIYPTAPPPADRPVTPGAAAVALTTPIGERAEPAGELPQVVHVTIAVPDTYLQAAVDAENVRSQRTAAAVLPDPNVVEQREVERLRGLVIRALPATVEANRLQVVIASYPAVVATSPRDRNAAPGLLASAGPLGVAPPTLHLPGNSAPAGTRLTAGPDADPENGVPQAEAPLPAMPREVWLAATSILVGLLAGFMWWAGGRERQTDDTQRIDWARGGADEPDAEASPASERRIAA